MKNWQAILEQALAGQRLTPEQALLLLQEAELHQLAQAAHSIRLRHNPTPVVTYVVDRNINYSNICVCGCKFCAFYHEPQKPGGFLLSQEDLEAKIQETLELGGTQILLQGSHHPSLDLKYFQDVLQNIKAKFPGLHIHAFSPPEIVHFARINQTTPAKILEGLLASGLDSIPGGGAEILVDRVRQKIAPNKCSTEQWIEVMRLAHWMGLRTTATMMFGHIETLDERVQHLLRLRQLQDKTQGFTAFIPWTFQPKHTKLQARETSSVQYLRLLAVSRLFLDNFAHLQASWVTMGAKIGQLALFFGADDFGSTMIEENVVAASGVRFRMDKSEIQHNISQAGFTPRQRKMDYTPA
ncbi:MAG: cyclic dehypoxanthinyl futalosine synthase [Thermodesulfobacteriota bacterium]